MRLLKLQGGSCIQGTFFSQARMYSSSKITFITSSLQTIIMLFKTAMCKNGRIKNTVRPNRDTYKSGTKNKRKKKKKKNKKTFET